MKSLFRNEAFYLETLRTAGLANSGCADLAEVIGTVESIADGDEAAWAMQWGATADRVARTAELSLAAGHRVSAREAFFRASTYYRTAGFFKRVEVSEDVDGARLADRGSQTFIQAARLLDTPFEVVDIPYAGTTLSGYLFLASAGGGSKPTIIYNNGFESAQEDVYGIIGAAALKRGYNVLAFDGPGQGRAVTRSRLMSRPDWEAVIEPVIDFALSRHEVASHRICLFGRSVGGYLAARAAAFDPRPAAIVLHDGVLDLHAAFDEILPPEVLSWIEAGLGEEADEALATIMASDPSVGWTLRSGMRALGLPSPSEVVRATKCYTLVGIGDEIKAATLLLDTRSDQFPKGQSQAIYAELTSPKSRLATVLTERSGQQFPMSSTYRLHQIIFDWLDETLVPARSR